LDDLIILPCVTEQDKQPSSIDSEPRCLNCGSLFTGNFCNECGQSGSVQRYSLKAIGREIYDQFRKIDATTTYRTFWQLAIQPGEFVRSYLSGQRVGFLGPVKYFFYSFVVQVFVGVWLFWLTNDSSFKELGHLEFRVEIVSFITTGFWGVLWALFYRKSGLTVIENMVAAILFVAQANFLSIILQLISYPLIRSGLLATSAVDIGKLSLQIIYSFYFVRKLFQEAFTSLIPKQLVLSVLYVVLVFLIFFLLFVSEMALKGEFK
jgi:hypothetical protein